MSLYTSRDLMEILRASMNAPSRPSPGYLVGELEAPSGGRRADALFFPLGHARRGEIHGYEFKISRSDLITELNDPMKADPWLRYCTTWTLFVADATLIDRLDIPAEWGICTVPPKNRRALTVLRPAPKLRPVDPTPALMQAIARLYYGHEGMTDERVKNLRESLEQSQEIERQQRTRAMEAEQRLRMLDPSQADPYREKLDEIVKHLRRKFSYPSALESLPAERLAELITDVARLEAIRDELAASNDRDLRDLELVHETRGRRLKQARSELMRRLP